jgi:uncharacterized protein
MPTVAHLSITPVKSTALHHPDQVLLERSGVAENRRFYFVNDRGRLFGGTRNGRLVAIHSDYDPVEEWLSLRFPDGSVAEGRAEAIGPVESTVFWGRPVLAREVAGPYSKAASEFLGQTVRLLRTELDGDGVDSHAASLVSSASIRELSKQVGDAVDARRFRMLVEVEGVGPHEEDSWIGRPVSVGEAVIEVIRPNARCDFTRRDPDTGETDLETLRAIKAYRGLRDRKNIDFGVYADVLRPGRIRVGDDIRLLPQEAVAPSRG